MPRCRFEQMQSIAAPGLKILGGEMGRRPQEWFVVECGRRLGVGRAEAGTGSWKPADAPDSFDIAGKESKLRGRAEKSRNRLF